MVKKSSSSFFATKKNIIWMVSGSVLVLLFFLTYYWLYQRSRTIVDDIIVEHIEELVDIFHSIDRTAGIVSFEHEKNYIDFLTVASFVGSEIGSMNLRNPAGWDGPYLRDNPTVQEKYYVVVASDQGYYIAPGDGVMLSNGKVIGKDLIWSKTTDFEAVAKDPELFLYKDRPLVRKIK